MTEILLLVRERPAGWQTSKIVPMLKEQESALYGALVGAGLSVEILDMRRFLEGKDENEDWHAVVVQPDDETLRALEHRMKAAGGSLVVVGDEGGERSDPLLRRTRWIRGVSIPLSLRLSRASKFRRPGGFRRFFSLPSRTHLRPAPGDAVMARWGWRGGPSVLSREMGRGRAWTLGFPLDYVEPTALPGLLQVLFPPHRAAASPLPEGARAVVLLLHDVEEALPDDPRGTQTVRDGIEACLRAQAKHSYRATYNLVGTFAEKIPDLVRRIAAEGHEVASHSATHRVVADLGPSELQEEVEGAEKRIVPLAGNGIRGFRSPRSRWSLPLLDVLQSRGYLWSAEADMSPFPYCVPRGYSSPLVRIPVAVDDWDYVKKSATPSAMNRLWKKEVRRAIDRGCWVGIGSHPSVLGYRPERMRAFDEFFDWLSGENVHVMTMSSACEWWLQRARAVKDLAAAEGEGRGRT